MGMMLFIISLIILVALLILFAVIMIRKRVKVSVLIVIVCLVALGGILSYNLLFYYNEKQVNVAISTNDDINFILHIKNHKLSGDYLYTEFVTSQSLSDLMQLIKETYPGSKTANYQDGVKVTVDNNVILIKQNETKHFLWKERYTYLMRAECFSLTISDDMHVCIPFPKEYIDTDGAYDTEMNITCGMDELKEFYADFTNVSINENSIIIEQEYKIRILVQDNKISIELE